MKATRQRIGLIVLMGIGLLWLNSALGARPEKVTVTGAEPETAVQGETLAVVVSGSGFDHGSSVRYLVSGTKDDTQITVISVSYNEADDTLTTNIHVEGEAVISDYDIEVRNSSGRRGKGTTLFKVQQAEDTVVTLEMTYEFGTLTNGACTTPECVSTTITATGPVDCTNLYCDFNSTSAVENFGLPSGLRDLLFATEWRRTPLNPDQCFGSSQADPGGGFALVDNTFIFLRRFHDGVTPWSAKVDALGLDVDGEIVRDYAFNFEGCGPAGCGDFASGSMEGEYIGGALKRIGVSGNDKKLKSVPCRCTSSNTPDCPGDVAVPIPPIRITVIETL